MDYYKKYEEKIIMLERKKTTFLGQLLLRLNKITAEQLREALLLQKNEQPRRMLGEILINQGVISREELYYALALQFLYPHVEIGRYKLNKEVINLIPQEVAMRYQLVPLDRFSDILTIGMANPLDREAIKTIEEMTHLKVRVFVVYVQDLKNAFDLIYK